MNLVMTLLYTRRAMPKARIREVVEAYRLAPSDEAFDRMFERDKEELRELGVPLVTEDLTAAWEDEPGYRIHQRDYALPQIDFAPDELAVLGLAARAWSHATLAGPAAAAVRKLHASGVESDGEAFIGIEPRLATSEPAFGPLLDAITTRNPVAFDYRRPAADAPVATRHVHPWGLTNWRGRWYLTGHDTDRLAPVFRLPDQRAVRTEGTAGSYDIREPRRPAMIHKRREPVSASPSSSAGRRPRYAHSAPPRSAARPPAGLACSCRSRPGGRGERARRLRCLGSRARPAGARRGHSRGACRRPCRPPEWGGSVSPYVPETATSRVPRLLTMVPWLVNRQGIDLASAAEELGISVPQLRSDLELLFMCGYGSMTDEMIDVEFEDGRIFISNAETIARPLRLGRAEALTLVVGLRALGGSGGVADTDVIERTLPRSRPRVARRSTDPPGLRRRR